MDSLGRRKLVSIITVSNIYAEDLFKWFYEHIMDSCGDGAGLIVCKNYKETAQFFIEWFQQKYKRPFYHFPDELPCIINYHDNNENFMFSNMKLNIFDKDYTFIVKGVCKFGWDKTNKTIEPIVEYER